MKKCIMCGENKYICAKGMCTHCYSLKNKVKHEIPQVGELKYDEEGNVICHICGYAYKKLMAHVWQTHKISSLDYKKNFGLNTTKGIINEEHKEVLREKVRDNYDVVVVGNLINNEASIANRYKSGHKGRTRDKISPYEMEKIKKRLNFNRK